MSKVVVGDYIVRYYNTIDDSITKGKPYKIIDKEGYLITIIDNRSNAYTLGIHYIGRQWNKVRVTNIIGGTIL